MTAPLKPCPFCGAEARLAGGPMAQETYSIWCTGTARHKMDYGFNRDAAITAWNTRADAPELLALVEAVKAEIEARNLFLATAPDRGGSHGTKGQRRMALENAQLATVFAFKAYEALQ